jgi:CrcB protein
MNHLLIVAAGGAIGAGLRHLVGLGALRFVGSAFPVATMTVNIAGSFLMGTLVAWLAFKADITGWPGMVFGSGQNLRLFLATGLLGGFTTFSAFSLDALLLWERGEAGMAALYVLGSVILSLAGLIAGLALVRALI